MSRRYHVAKLTQWLYSKVVICILGAQEHVVSLVTQILRPSQLMKTVILTNLSQDV